MNQSEELPITYKTSATQTLVLLFLLLILLVFLLVFLYKKLNKETNGKYTVRRMVYKEGGVRDRVRGAAMVLETRLGMNLWPRSDAEEDAAEMQELQDEEGRVERGSQGSESQEEEEEECGERKGKGDDSSDDYSESEGSNLSEQAELKDQEEAEEKREEKGENMEDGESSGKGEVSGGASLLIDLKQFSGSAIWSEEKNNEDMDNDVTASGEHRTNKTREITAI